MNFDPPIKAEWFYANESEKTKINWFCYEYALEFFDFIEKSKALRKYRAKHSSEEIASFCAFYAKRMKISLYNWLAGIAPVVYNDEEYAAEYYPHNTGRQNRVLLEVAGEAWDSLLSNCETCPVRCISERERRSEFFERYA